MCVRARSCARNLTHPNTVIETIISMLKVATPWKKTSSITCLQWPPNQHDSLTTTVLVTSLAAALLSLYQGKASLTSNLVKRCSVLVKTVHGPKRPSLDSHPNTHLDIKLISHSLSLFVPSCLLICLRPSVPFNCQPLFL